MLARAPKEGLFIIVLINIDVIAKVFLVNRACLKTEHYYYSYLSYSTIKRVVSIAKGVIIILFNKSIYKAYAKVKIYL